MCPLLKYTLIGKGLVLFVVLALVLGWAFQ